MPLRAGYWWIDRWRKSTAYNDMTLAEQGAYRNLLDELWLRDGLLPDNERVLAKIAGDALEWPTVRAAVMARFTRTPTGWRNLVHDEIASTSMRLHRSQSDKGRKGAAARWGPTRDGRGNGPANGQSDGPVSSPAIPPVVGPAYRLPDPDPDPDPDLDLDQEQEQDKERNHTTATVAPTLAPRRGSSTQPSAEAVADARYFLDAILSHKPDFAGPKTLDGWAVEFDRARRLDNRTTAAIRAVIDFAHRDPRGAFWRANILSGKTLREQFDKLEIQSRGGGTATRPDFGPKPPVHDPAATERRRLEREMAEADRAAFRASGCATRREWLRLKAASGGAR